MEVLDVVEPDGSANWHRDAWAPLVNRVIEEEAALGRSRCVTELFNYLWAHRSKKPTETWREHVASLVTTCVAAPGRLLSLVQAMASCPRQGMTQYRNFTVESRVCLGNEDLARAVIYAAGLTEESGLVGALTDVAIDAAHRSLKMTNAAIAVLGEVGSDEAVRALCFLDRRLTAKDYLKAIAKALDGVAALRGTTREVLAEAAVEDVDLDRQGRLVVTVGDAQMTIALEDMTGLTVAWTSADGRRSSRPPKQVAASHPEAVKDATRRASELRTLFASERERLDRLQAGTRTWAVADWKSNYLVNPITANLSRRLLWTLLSDADSQSISGFPREVDDQLSLRTCDESTIPDLEHGRIATWHPLTSSPEEVATWRDFIVQHEIVQPFKQAFRETYVVTDAERVTGTYSNRFAGHVLRYQQAYALMRGRGWSVNLLGGWDGTRDGIARREFQELGLSAVFFHEGLDSNSLTGKMEYCRTDQVRFSATFGAGGTLPRSAIPVEDVPPLVFSEAMRDVDLFVSVSSISTDPTWQDAGEDRFIDYWTGETSGELRESGISRRDALRRLLPGMAIADRCSISEKFLEVQGDRSNYKIHLGSGAVFLSPSNRHVCIVPSPRSRPSVRYLPFVGDDMLTIIISKAFMLADDTAIKDPVILNQLDPSPL